MEEFCECVTTDAEIIEAIDRLNVTEEFSQPWMYQRHLLTWSLLGSPYQGFVHQGVNYHVDYDGDLHIDPVAKNG